MNLPTPFELAVLTCLERLDADPVYCSWETAREKAFGHYQLAAEFLEQKAREEAKAQAAERGRLSVLAWGTTEQINEYNARTPAPERNPDLRPMKP